MGCRFLACPVVVHYNISAKYETRTKTGTILENFPDMHVHIAIPVLDEQDWIFRCLGSLTGQEDKSFTVWICVNQPETWWSRRDTAALCRRNRETLQRLQGYRKLPLKVLDRTSRGRGWTGKDPGVGLARKTLMDAIFEECEENDVIASLDADTVVSPGYVAGLRTAFQANPEATGLSLPYFHLLGGDESANRAILRYECYMRHYVLNMFRIGSPYAFTALGSAMAYPAWAYRKSGGMPLRLSGEDFYMLQKLAKMGTLIHWAPCRVYPAARRSDRVVFGTGRAVSTATWEDWNRYPLFSPALFDAVGETVRLFPALYDGDTETPLSEFLRGRLGTNDIWGSLRSNHSSPERFIRACHERLDGLRVFQYLRDGTVYAEGQDENNLIDSLRRVCSTFDGPDETVSEWEALLGALSHEDVSPWSFRSSPIPVLDAVRRLLMNLEDWFRRKDVKPASGEGAMEKVPPP